MWCSSHCHNPPPFPGTIGLPVLKQPRVGSTWVKSEMNRLPGVHIEFEPVTDSTKRCSAEFTNAVLARMLREPVRCVSRKEKASACYWAGHCNHSLLPASPRAAPHISGFLLHPHYVPKAAWPTLLRAPAVRLVVLRRTNLVKRTVSNMLRVAEEGDEPESDAAPPGRRLASKHHAGKPPGGGGGSGGHHSGHSPAHTHGGTAAAVVAAPPPPPASAPARRNVSFLEPAELLRQTKGSLRSFVGVPEGVALDAESTFLVLYEDLQAARLQACRAAAAACMRPPHGAAGATHAWAPAARVPGAHCALT